MLGWPIWLSPMEAEGGHRLALAKRGGGDGAHQHQLARRFGERLEQLEAEFALVVTVRMELVRRDGEALGQRVNGETGDWREISISLSISTSLACQVKYAAQSSGINRVIQ